MSPRKSARSSAPSSKIIVKTGLLVDAPAATSKTTTTTMAAGKHVTTNRVTSSTGTKVQSKSTTYEYLKVKETVTTKYFHKQKIAGPGSEIVTSHRSQDLCVSSTSKNSNSCYKSNGAGQSKASDKQCVSHGSNKNYSYSSTGYARCYDSNTGKSSVQVYKNSGNNKAQNSSYHSTYHF